MIRGFFFDLDGTLVDTHEANYEAYKRALADHGVDITFNDFKRTIGMQAKDFLPKLAPNLDKDAHEAIAHLKAGYYKDLIHLSTLNKALHGFMHSMSEHYTTALVTTAKHANAMAVLEYHEIKGYFDHIITANDVVKSKPAPDGYILALERTGLKASEVIAFEDSDVGRQAAEAAGISVVMVREFAV